MNLILLGPPGAGKGTQAKMIAAKYDLPHISTGDMFREAVQSGSELGQRLKSYMVSGKLVPDEVVIDVVRERLSRQDCARGFLLDGFPRTVPQAKELDRILAQAQRKIDAVLNIYLNDEEIVKRLSSRRVCGSCGASYNLISQPPKADNICDVCGKQLIHRPDETPETVRNRLKVYNEQTSPLIEYYTQQAVLFKIDGSQKQDKVFGSITAIVDKI
jgi:adenylate kinase